MQDEEEKARQPFSGDQAQETMCREIIKSRTRRAPKRQSGRLCREREVTQGVSQVSIQFCAQSPPRANPPKSS